ncbi:MAG: Arc family DNA-binding protein [Burkholderiales bacterium]|jgi:plasmid stability protein|nr:Arc family DNA-binding protein [Burkholderiales bacterium]
MPVTITLKNIPESLYESLKAAAAQNRRSLNGEVLERLESSVETTRELSHEEKVLAVEKVREMLRGRNFDLDLVDVFKREGRP